jgi:hypothetical protein
LVILGEGDYAGLQAFGKQAGLATKSCLRLPRISLYVPPTCT